MPHPEADSTAVASYPAYEVRVVKKLLVFVLFVGCAAYVGAAPRSPANASPSPDPQAAQTGHLDVPRNCQTTTQADGSVLTTCECENCGQPEARDGSDPLPWACVSRQGAMHCDYGETEEPTTGGLQKDRI
jgi:hypothetical protein